MDQRRTLTVMIDQSTQAKTKEQRGATFFREHRVDGLYTMRCLGLGQQVTNSRLLMLFTTLETHPSQKKRRMILQQRSCHSRGMPRRWNECFFFAK